jgi:hypothetical protein
MKKPKWWRPYTDPSIEEFVENLCKEKGYEVEVHTPSGNWLVPRHFIALYGLKSYELPNLAKQFKFKKLS